MAKPILVEHAHSILNITLNRPRLGNLMTAAMIRQLTEAIGTVKRGSGTRAVVIRAKGKDFCLGRDNRTDQSKTPRPHTAWDMHERVTSLILDSYAACRNCPVPVIAVVQGHAKGFGSGIVGACDMALAADSAVFSTPEMLHGITPTLVMTALQDVNRKTLVDMVYSGEPIDAATALSVGLVGRIVAADALAEADEKLCATLRSYDAIGVEVMKGFLSKPGRLQPDDLSQLADFTLAAAFTRPRN